MSLYKIRKNVEPGLGLGAKTMDSVQVIQGWLTEAVEKESFFLFRAFKSLPAQARDEDLN